MALQIDASHGDFGTYKLRLAGNLDSDTFQQFDEAVSAALSDPATRALRLDLHDLRFISSMGLGSVVKARKAIEQKGGVFAIVGAQPQVRKVFEIARMLPEETVFATREEADEYLAMIQRKVLEEQGEGDQPGV